MPIVNQPPGDPFLIASLPDDPAKEDLDFRARDVRAGYVARGRVAVARTEGTVSLRMDLFRELMVGGAVAIEMFHAWVGNGRVSDREFTSLGAAFRDTPGFQRAATQFEGRLQENLRAQWRTGTVDYRDLVTGSGPVRAQGASIPDREPGRGTGRVLPSISPPWVDLSLRHDRVCKICCGSIQGIHIRMRGFTATASPAAYTATLGYELRDHFGVDDEDCDISGDGFHGTPGQIAMWVLQHHRRPGHVPFITVARVERAVRGVLI